MARFRLFCIRIVGALALCSFAFVLVSLDPFLSAAALRSGVSARTPVTAVNRFRKGNRLPISQPGTAGRETDEHDGLQSSKKVPFGCDPAFSPVTTPSLSTVYGRCMA